VQEHSVSHLRGVLLTRLLLLVCCWYIAKINIQLFSSGVFLGEKSECEQFYELQKENSSIPRNYLENTPSGKFICGALELISEERRCEKAVGRESLVEIKFWNHHFSRLIIQTRG